ncbi:unnamed protein product [Rotaria magnacalcarata]|uniref:WAP domain-containing protein n=1 Tax=Rotaria magnacalcarata TaxID=392030 RepID=A0A816GDE2_9BILA|nr:unnamed protein product [Rotaria magnacalcarata]CAF1672685.1 unnamed protein product [Rotaria magnacalcarata]CAF2104243.1 unnamed protein product [Rotaria magnacalcarata]CAF3981500.1 unnamed protein product [Rotaria magnacalcarata]CAF4003123.1 unnamed protein product [Rotaria magnacalcarata]
MNKLSVQLLVATFTIICLCTAQEDPTVIDLPIISPIVIPRPTIKLPGPTIKFPPVTINPYVLCFVFPLPNRCNPCKFGQPLQNVPCGQGQNLCASHNGTCKVNIYDRAYCCPNERQGCCPPVASTPIVLANPSITINLPLCRPACRTDAECPTYQKCCGSCSRCANATFA